MQSLLTPENIVTQMRKLMTEELSTIFGEQVISAQLSSPTIVQQHGFYAWLRNVVEAGCINTYFEDHSNETPVAHRIIRKIWTSREPELINLFEVNRNVEFALERNVHVNTDSNLQSRDATRTDQDEDQTIGSSSYPKTELKASGHNDRTRVPQSQDYWKTETPNLFNTRTRFSSIYGSSGRWFHTFHTTVFPKEQDILAIKEQTYNRRHRQALELLFEFYNKHKQFSGTVDNDWRGILAQFLPLANEYETDDQTRLAQFLHSLKIASMNGIVTKSSKL